MDAPQRYKLIACEIMFRELSYCAALSRNIIDITFMPKGLHDMGERKMTQLLQAALDEVDASRYDAILLGYGLCNNGIRGLHAALPLVVPRAHDCITLLLGSKEQYAAYFQAHPGTYYKSPGWIERSQAINGNPDTVMNQLGIDRTYEEYAAKFGEENARYLMEMFGDWVKNYSRLAYIDTAVVDPDTFRQQTRAEAEERAWEYDELQGDTGLLRRLLGGPWDPQDFLVVPVSQTIRPSHDDSIIGLA
jgi:hypothetical protein